MATLRSHRALRPVSRCIRYANSTVRHQDNNNRFCAHVPQLRQASSDVGHMGQPPKQTKLEFNHQGPLQVSNANAKSSTTGPGTGSKFSRTDSEQILKQNFAPEKHDKATAKPEADQSINQEGKSMVFKYFPEFSMEKKVVIITGGGRGLGLTMAEALYQSGAIVHCLDRLPEPADEFTRVRNKTDRIPGGQLHYHSIDIRASSNLQKLIATIAGTYDRLDGCVAAAGVQKVTPALEYQEEDVKSMLDVNFTAAFMTAQEVGKQMIRFKTPGSIVLVGSISGQIANRGLNSPIYNSSKAAIIQLARNLAMEWGQHNIRVNALCPGHIYTPMVAKNFEEEPHLEEIWKHEIMLARLANPDEFRGVILFLLSQASSFVTGSALTVDGGQTAW